MGGLCVCVCVFTELRGVKGRLFKLGSLRYANENRVHTGVGQLSKNTDSHNMEDEWSRNPLADSL